MMQLSTLIHCNTNICAKWRFFEWMKTKEICSYPLSFQFYLFFTSLLPFSNNEYVYVISKIGAAAGVINIVMMSVFLYFQSKKTGHLLN